MLQQAKNSNNSEEVKNIQYAHEILSDPFSRKIYDEAGLEGLQNRIQMGAIVPYGTNPILDRIKELESHPTTQQHDTGTNLKCWMDLSSLLSGGKYSGVDFLGVLLSSSYTVRVDFSSFKGRS